MPTPGSTRHKSDDEFSGEIVVTSRIVDYLSSGLYESPAACLKELINNSYDADARQVKVFVQPDANRIIISDDGHGMDRVDFEKNFSRISETFKRTKSTNTKLGRPKIGKIGIGFIAANEICDIMEVHSTKRGSSELINVTINFAKMRQELGARRRSDSEFAKGDYHGKVLTTDRDKHYTNIFLREVRGEARNILAGASSPTGHDGQKYTLYGKADEQIAKDLKILPISSWADFDPYSETMLRVALNIPVKYHEGWMPRKLHHRVRDFERMTEALDFSVFYDGTDLRKPIVLRDDEGDSIVKLFTYKGKSVSARGYFYVQHGSLKPQDLNGLLVRIRHAAIGGYDPSFIGFPSSRGTLFQKWISAEVWASDELEDAMNIDRKTLRIAHPAFVEFQQAIHDQLSEVLSLARDQIYRAGSQRRRSQRADENIEKVVRAVSSHSPQVSREVVQKIEKAWIQNRTASQGTDKSLLQKFSVADLYTIVMEVAAEILSPAQMSRFLAALTNRLTKR